MRDLKTDIRNWLLVNIFFPAEVQPQPIDYEKFCAQIQTDLKAYFEDEVAEVECYLVEDREIIKRFFLSNHIHTVKLLKARVGSADETFLFAIKLPFDGGVTPEIVVA